MKRSFIIWNCFKVDNKLIAPIKTEPQEYKLIRQKAPTIPSHISNYDCPSIEDINSEVKKDRFITFCKHSRIEKLLRMNE